MQTQLTFKTNPKVSLSGVDKHFRHSICIYAARTDEVYERGVCHRVNVSKGTHDSIVF